MMSSANDGRVESLVDLQRLAAGIRWRRRMWGGLALAGLVAGVLSATVLPGASAASAQIYVVHQTEQSGDAEASTKTDLALLKSTSVAREAVARSPVDKPAEDYVEDYSGEVVAANVLMVTAPGPDDERAVANARALADAFVAVYVRQTDERARAEVQTLQDRRREVQRELAGLGGSTSPGAGSVSGPPGRAERVTALSSQLSAIEQLTVEAEIGTPKVAAGTMVIDEARVTSRPPLVSAVLFGLIGLLAGLGGGLALAAVATVARDRPVLRRDIGAHLGASVVAQIPGPATGPLRPRPGARSRAEHRRVAAILARMVRQGTGPVSVLELGCRRTAAGLVRAMAEELASDARVVLVDDLPGGLPVDAAGSGNDAVEVVAASGVGPETDDGASGRRLGIGTLVPGTSWTELHRLGAETILVVRAGTSEASWLHTVARQLADEGIAVIGVVVVRPDPRDRSDGTLWDPLHTAIRGRAVARSRGLVTGPAVRPRLRANGSGPVPAAGADPAPPAPAGNGAAPVVLGQVGNGAAPVPEQVGDDGATAVLPVVATEAEDGSPTVRFRSRPSPYPRVTATVGGGNGAPNGQAARNGRPDAGGAGS